MAYLGLVNPEFKDRIYIKGLRLYTIKVNIQEALSSALKKKERIDGVCVQAEFREPHKSYIEFSGLKFIEELRLKYKLKIPILITSSLPFTELFDGSEDWRKKFQVYRDPGLFFKNITRLMLMQDIGQLFYNKPLTLEENLFDDVVNSIYDKRGMVNEYFHYKRTQISKGNVTKSSLHAFLQDLEAYAPKANTLIGEIKELVNQTNTEDVQKRASEWIDRLENQIFLQSQNFDFQKKIKILLIDDDDLAWTDKLRLYNIDYEKAENYEESFEILKSDKTAEIRVIVCDYRFYTKNDRYQSWQGYQIISKLDNVSPRKLRFISLSSYPASFVSDFASKHAISTIPFSKKDLLGEDNFGVQGLARLIHQEHGKLADRVAGSLKVYPAQWRATVEKYKDSDLYKDNEREINEIVMSFLEAFVADKKVEGFSNLYETLDRKRGEEAQKTLIRNLKFRRLALGLWQLDRVKYLKIDELSRPGIVWNEVYNIIASLKEHGVTLTSKQGNDLNRNIGFKKPRSHRWEDLKDDKELEGILSKEEIDWLEKHYQYLTQL